MDKVEAYLYLLTDTLTKTIAIVPNSGIVLESMLIFGTYDKALIAISLFVGSMIGSIINWVLGIALYSVPYRNTKPSEQVIKATTIFNLYIVWILLLPSLNLIGPLGTMAAGFFKVRFRLFIILTTIGQVLYSLYSAYIRVIS